MPEKVSSSADNVFLIVIYDSIVSKEWGKAHRRAQIKRLKGRGSMKDEIVRETSPSVATARLFRKMVY
jgi:hypothetical protein